MESDYFVHLCGSLALRHLDPEALDELVVTMRVGTENERQLAFDYLAECAALSYERMRGPLCGVGSA